MIAESLIGIHYSIDTQLKSACLSKYRESRNKSPTIPSALTPSHIHTSLGRRKLSIWTDS